MKILLITNHRSSASLCSCYERAFISLGHEVEQAIPDSYMSLGIRVKKKLHPFFLDRTRPNIYEKKLVKIAKDFNPDVIIVFQCELFSPKLLEDLREYSLRGIYNIWSDNPYVDWSVIANNLYLPLRVYDAVFISTLQHVPLFYQLGANNVMHLPFGFDPLIHYPVEQSEKDIDIAYFGSYGKTAERFLSPLIGKYKIKIFGNHWEKSKGSDLFNVWERGIGFGEDMRNQIARSKIVVNFIRQKHVTGTSMKVYELPACKAFMLTNFTEEVGSLLRKDVDCIFFNSIDDLAQKIEFFIGDVEIRNTIANNAYLKVKNSETYTERAKDLLFKLG